MSLPTPERGLVISYAYLWDSEHRQGREEGSKNRPCVVILAIENSAEGVRVLVAPVTHSDPLAPEAAVEIPLKVKQRLGLDDDRSWVMVSEVNSFVWPGPDIRPVAPERFDYGLLPPALFQQIQERFGAYFSARQLRVVPRTE